MSTPGPGAGHGPTTADEFLADLRADAAVDERRRERWLRHRLAEEATLGGALVAAVGGEVALQLSTGDRVTGRLVDVGADVVEVELRAGRAWVSVAAVAAVEVAAQLPAAGSGPGGRALLEVLVDLSAECSRVQLHLAGGTAVRGELVAAGEVATVRTGPGGRTAYVPLDAVAWVLSTD